MDASTESHPFALYVSSQDESSNGGRVHVFKTRDMAVLFWKHNDYACAPRHTTDGDFLPYAGTNKTTVIHG